MKQSNPPDPIQFRIPLTPCKPRRKPARARKVRYERITDHTAPLPASVVARGADTGSTHGTRSR